MTDPVQVVAEAPCVLKAMQVYDCGIHCDVKHPECAVAALKAAGLLAEGTLLPAESMALTVARAQTERGEAVPPNTATVLVLALNRLTGRSDWTQAAPAPASSVSSSDAGAGGVS